MNSETLKDLIVVKRSGQRVNFNSTKIAIAIKRAFDSVYDAYDEKDVNKVFSKVVKEIEETYQNRKTINVEDIQDIIEKHLSKLKYNDVYDSFNKYRLRRAASREVFSMKQQHKFVKAIEKIGYTKDSNDTKKPDELLDTFAKTISKEFASAYLIDNKVVRALEEGTIYLNDLKCYSLGNTSSAHLNTKYIQGSNIDDFFNETIKTIILCKKDQYKEHTLMNFDTILIKKVLIDYKKIIKNKFINYLKLTGTYEYFNKDEFIRKIEEIENLSDYKNIRNILKNEILKQNFDTINSIVIEEIKENLSKNYKKLFKILDIELTEYNKIIICLDNYDTYENNLIVENYLKSLEKTQKIITNIYLNNNKEINELITEKILSKIKIHLITEENRTKNYFSNGEKVFENINDQINTSLGRTINSTVTINLSRIALKKHNLKDFYNELDEIMDLSKNALLARYEVQANKYKENFNCLFSKGLLFDSEKLEDNKKIRKVIRNGIFFIGYSGIIEAISILNKKEDNKINEKDLNTIIEILKHMKSKTNQMTIDNKLNFDICETYDKKILQEFCKIDKSVYGFTKSINKNLYEPFNKYINNINDYNKKIELQGIYQKYTSSLTKIIINKKTDKQTILKMLDNLKSSENKYIEIDVTYDN